MTLYKGNSKIKDRGSFGVYAGSQPIYSIYKGSELVYQWNPYDPGEAVINRSDGSTVTMTIKRGLYYVEVVGAGGAAKHMQINQYAFINAGGSGARFSANINFLGDITITMSCGAAGQTTDGGDSTLAINGNLIATAGGGKRGWPDKNEIGYGGTVTANPTATGVVFSNVTTINGNEGDHTSSAGSRTIEGGASVASQGTYGKGASANWHDAPHGKAGENGWIYLKYIGAN